MPIPPEKHIDIASSETALGPKIANRHVDSASKDSLAASKESMSGRHSTTQRGLKSEAGIKSARSNSSLSNLLNANTLKKKFTALVKQTSGSECDEENSQVAELPSNLAKSKLGGSQSQEQLTKKGGRSSNKSTNGEYEPSALSRLLSFAKNKKTAQVIGHSPSTPGLNETLATRRNDSELVLPAKGPGFANSAYDIRGPLGVQKIQTLDDYYLIRRVGKGGFATVFLVRLKGATGRYFALKAMKKQEVVRLRQERQIMNEKNILMELKHWLLVELYHTFQTPSNLLMIMEFVCGGDLFTLLRKSKNILLDSTGNIKLADFGFAKRLTTTTSSFCGTPDYIAYEIVASKPYSFAVDWWSLGVLVFELVSGKTPFRADSSEGIYTNIQSGKIQWVSQTSGPIKDLVVGLLKSDPNARLGAKGAHEIKNSAWFGDLDWEKLANRHIPPPVVPPFIPPESLEQEKVTRGGTTDYKELADDHTGKPTDFSAAFKGF